MINLLGAQLVGEAAGVDHGLLGLLLRVLGVGHQVVDVGLKFHIDMKG